MRSDKFHFQFVKKKRNLFFKCHLYLADKSRDRKVSCYSCYLQNGHNLALERLDFSQQIYLGVEGEKSATTPKHF